MDAKNRIKASIQKCLSDISDDEAFQLAEFLYENDFTTVADLQYVALEDIRELTSLGRCRKLLKYWGQGASATETVSSAGAGSSRQAESSSAGATSSFAGSSSQSSLHDQAKRLNSVNLPTFTVDSPFMPASVRAAIKAGQRAPSRGREDMVQRIVDHCRETIPGFQRQNLDTVANQLVTLYPSTFKDTLPLSEHGSDGLAKQLKINLDNRLRVKCFATANERQAPNAKEAFGCVRWNPLLEEGETLESQEKKRELLVNMHKLTKKQWQWKEIRSNMEQSFYLQRRDINGELANAASSGKKNKKRKSGDDSNEVDDPAAPVPKGMPVAEVKVRWPFMFTSKGMNYHFRILTGKDFKDLLSKFSSEVVMTVEYLACKGEEFAKLKRKLDRADRAGRADAKLIGLLLMLFHYFKEDLNYLVTFVDEVTTLDEIPYESLPASQTPILVAAGTTLFNAEKFFVFIDNNAVATLSDFPDALSLVFCSYFTFNIEYPKEIASVMIFIQRVIAKINAVGSKSKNFKTACEKVTKFYNKFQEYKEKVENEENEIP